MDSDTQGIVATLAIFATLGAAVVAALLVRVRTARREGERLTALLRAAGATPPAVAVARNAMMPERAFTVAFRDDAVHRGRRLVTELAHATRFEPRKTYVSLQVAAPMREEGRLLIVGIGRTVIPWISIVHRSRSEEWGRGKSPQTTGDGEFDAVFDVWATLEITSSGVRQLSGPVELSLSVRSALRAAGPRAQHATYHYDGCFVSAGISAWPVDAATLGEVLGILHALADDAPALKSQLVAGGATRLANQS